ncbi:hydrolase [Streptomyces sp. NPDC003077]|uniref:hydrolase n=1 Tax=Streptomyces sp. NPDC003077 TaxID=3154443 RepID=UPI0033B9B2EA
MSADPLASGPSLLLTNAGTWGGPDGTATVDVLLRAGRVEQVFPAGGGRPAPPPHTGRPQDPRHLDLTGHLLLPAPAEPHCHLDKALTGPLGDRAHDGDLDGAVRAWYAHRRQASRARVRERALRVAERLLASGATAVRTHLDVGEATGLLFLEALGEVKERLRGRLELQLVAMVDLPLRGPAGAGNRAALADALAAGADVVGGAPYRDEDPAACLDILMDRAAGAGRPLDLHIDETLDPRADSLGALAARVRETGFPYGVTASHCVSLAMRPPEAVARTAARVAAAGIAVVACPATNLYLQGRAHGGLAVPRGLTALAHLRAAGVTVAGGGDNVRDPFLPLGRCDPLDTAALLVLAGHLTPGAAYDAVSRGARAAMGLPAPELRAGAPAELLAVRATTPAEALADGADRLVFHRGRVVCRTRRETEFLG